METSSSQGRFLRACRGEPVDRPPVWLMRQAGRYLPEYRAVRERAGDFLALCRTPDLAAEVTLQPIRRFGFDAAIIFSDILIPAVAMGAEVSFAEGEGPRIANPVRSAEDVARLAEPEPREASPFLFEAIRIVRRELGPLGDPPVIGFAAAPFTLASYLVEGGTSRGFETSRAFLLEGGGAAAHALLAKVARVVAAHLLAQVEAGARALQLFDTWAGFLGPADYRRAALPYVRQVLEAVRAAVGPDVPLIYFVNGVAPFFEDAASPRSLDVLSVDWRIDLREARGRARKGMALQGNLDPAILLAGPAATARRTREVLEAGGGRAHIMNLGHGVLPGAPIASVEALVTAVREFRSPP